MCFGLWCGINSLVVPVCHRRWKGDFTLNRKQVANRLKIPQGLSTLMFRRWSEFPQGEGSAVVHRKKNYLLYKDTRYQWHSLWESDFTCHREQVVNWLKIP